MSQNTGLPLTAFVQASTKRHLVLRASTAAEWSHQWPTDRIGDILVTETPGSIDGSVFAFWLGEKSPYNPSVRAWIQAHLEDHDVVRIYFVPGLPDEVHSSLKQDLVELKAKAAAADHKTEAIAWADAYLNNACLPTYTKLSDALRWKPIETAPKDRYILGRDPHMKRPFVMLWNVPGQRFEALAGFGDETPTQWMDLPTG